jgi:choline/glycine/proline betaine transport protein
MADWTVFFWAWWIAWAPFVSLFLARISRGRTLRQFVIGVLLIPFAFILLWVSIFGNAALSFFRAGETEFLDLAISVPESGFFTLLEQYPGAVFTVALAVVTGLFFYVTSADSGSLVMANMTSKPSIGNDDGPPWLRIVWAVITGALTLVMLFIDGVYTLQAVTVMIGLPLSVLVYLIMFSLWKVLRTERVGLDSRLATLPALLSSRIHEDGERGNWRQRLAHRMSFASESDMTRFVQEVAAPAVEEVAAELTAMGADVDCHRGSHPESSIPYIDLVVRFPEHQDFKYQAYPVEYSVPSFALNLSAVEDTFYRLEIFSAHGSKGRDIMGYTKEQVISDVLDAYDLHMMYMSMSGDNAAPTGQVPVDVPQEWPDTEAPATGPLPVAADAGDQGSADHSSSNEEKYD